MDLATVDLLPAEHLVDQGYVDTELLLTSQTTHGVALIGPIPVDQSWQATAGHGFALTDFAVDWEAGTAQCPTGKTSTAWRPATDQYGDPVIHVNFGLADCAACPSRSQCTRSATSGRKLTLRPRCETRDYGRCPPAAGHTSVQDSIRRARRRNTSRLSMSGRLIPARLAVLPGWTCIGTVSYVRAVRAGQRVVHTGGSGWLAYLPVPMRLDEAGVWTLRNGLIAYCSSCWGSVLPWCRAGGRAIKRRRPMAVIADRCRRRTCSGSFSWTTPMRRSWRGTRAVITTGSGTASSSPRCAMSAGSWRIRWRGCRPKCVVCEEVRAAVFGSTDLFWPHLPTRLPPPP